MRRLVAVLSMASATAVALFDVGVVAGAVELSLRVDREPGMTHVGERYISRSLLGDASAMNASYQALRIAAMSAFVVWHLLHTSTGTSPWRRVLWLLAWPVPVVGAIVPAVQLNHGLHRDGARSRSARAGLAIVVWMVFYLCSQVRYVAGVGYGTSATGTTESRLSLGLHLFSELGLAIASVTLVLGVGGLWIRQPEVKVFGHPT
jgi:hypothetical protein